MHNPSGALRVVVTKSLPGDRWLKVLTASGCRVEVSADPDTIHSNGKIKKLIGDKCDGVIGQLTEVGGCWRHSAGGRAGSPVLWQQRSSRTIVVALTCRPGIALARLAAPRWSA